MPFRPTEPSRLGPALNDETDLTEPARHELVAEAAATFGEAAARDLAELLRVPFEVYPEAQP